MGQVAFSVLQLMKQAWCQAWKADTVSIMRKVPEGIHCISLSQPQVSITMIGIVCVNPEIFRAVKKRLESTLPDKLWAQNLMGVCPSSQ